MPDHLRSSPERPSNSFVEMAASKETTISPEVLAAVARLAPRFTLGDVRWQNFLLCSRSWEMIVSLQMILVMCLVPFAASIPLVSKCPHVGTFYSFLYQAPVAIAGVLGTSIAAQSTRNDWSRKPALMRAYSAFLASLWNIFVSFSWLASVPFEGQTLASFIILQHQGSGRGKKDLV